MIAKLVEVFEDAARCERMLPKVKAPGRPNMYAILDFIHDRKDLGFYQKKQLRLRPNPKLLGSWDLVIDLLLLANNQDRKILWSKANKFKYTQIGRMLGLDRRKVKSLYLTALIDLEQKIKQNKSLLAKLDKI